MTKMIAKVLKLIATTYYLHVLELILKREFFSLDLQYSGQPEDKPKSTLSHSGVICQTRYADRRPAKSIVKTPLPSSMCSEYLKFPDLQVTYR